MPKPWLLDQNVPAQLARWLNEAGIPRRDGSPQEMERAPGQGVGLAAENDFEVLVTRDRDFAQAAGAALTDSDLAVILLSIKQARAAPFLEAFRKAWAESRPEIKPGQVVRWLGR